LRAFHKRNENLAAHSKNEIITCYENCKHDLSSGSFNSLKRIKTSLLFYETCRINVQMIKKYFALWQNITVFKLGRRLSKKTEKETKFGYPIKGISRIVSIILSIHQLTQDPFIT